MAHFAHTMLPLQFCYQFYACLILLAFFCAISVVAIAVMTLYGVGGVELVFTICFVLFHALLRLFMPPWTRPSSAPTPSFNIKEEHLHAKRLALDKYLYEAEEEQKQSEIHEDSNPKFCRPTTARSPCCPICLHSFKVGEEVSEGRTCRHVFHTDCLDPWLLKSTSCPYCRQDLEERTKSSNSDVHKAGAWGIFDGIFDSLYA